MKAQSVRNNATNVHSNAQLQCSSALLLRSDGHRCMVRSNTRRNVQRVGQVSVVQSINHRPQLACCAQAATVDESARQTDDETEIAPGVFEGFWTWRGFRIRYQRCGNSGPPALMVHGFGGNCDHWRKNLPVVGKRNRAFAIDLLGYGYSDKPDPRAADPGSLYTFEVWGKQLLDFIDEVISEPTFLVSNSVGGLAALEAAIEDPQRVRGVFVTNISLRMLHASKQSRFQRPFVAALQRTLRETAIGEAFFANVAKARTVKTILQQCYGDKSAVTDELVQYVLKPGLDAGAARVFLEFLSYSSGPLPEEQFAKVQVPVAVLWGAADPWEKVDWGRDFCPANYPAIEDYIELPGVGHCPMDEAPHLVNPRIQQFIDRHADKAADGS